LRAAVDAFERDGYPAMSIEGVAALAGVGKASIYRRYPSKAALVADAVRQAAHIDDSLPDTGDVRADLAAMLRPLFDRLRGPEGPLLVRFATERVRNPDLAEAFERAVIGRKRDHIRRLLDGAIRRGDLHADADVALIAETGPALLWHHALHELPLDDTLVDRIIDLVLPGGRTRPAASRRAPRAARRPSTRTTRASGRRSEPTG
jgi:AcrR family transcriptional regulator